MTDKKKPLLWDTELAEDTEADLARFEAAEMLRASEDPNYIPGYTEYVKAESLAAAEYGSMAYQQRAYQMRQLGVTHSDGPPIKIKPVRVAGLDGRVNDNVLLDQARYRADGYTPMTVADLERYGMKMPPLYSVFADGTIRRGDVALWFVDAQRAKQIAKRKFDENKEREGTSATVGASTGVPIELEFSRDENFSL